MLKVRKVLVVACTILLVLALGSLAASAKGFQLGEIKVGVGGAYGSLTISDHDEDEVTDTTLPLISVNGSFQALPRLKLLAGYAFGTKTLDDSDDWGNYWYLYRNLDIAAAFALTDNIDLVAGYTRFISGFTDDYEENKEIGGGFKAGVAARLPLAKGLWAEAGYAFMPHMTAVTLCDEEEYYNYSGQGHEIKAGLEYITGFGLGVALGFRTESYTGVSDCCQDYHHNLAGFSGGTLNLSYRF